MQAGGQTSPLNVHFLNERKQHTVTQFDAKYKMYEGWNFNSGNYLFTTDTK